MQLVVNKCLAHKRMIGLFLTSLIVVVFVFQTRKIDLRFLPTHFKVSVTAVMPTTSHTVRTTPEPDSPEVRTFYGRLINSSDQLEDVNIKSFRCIKAKRAGMTIPVCVYGENEDVFVSNSFIQGGYFEGSMVERFVRLLRRYPDVQLVDLGANIGTYTLPTARVAQVVAVEPYSKTMARLFKSVHLGGVEKNVSLVLNGISNQRSIYTLGFDSGNIGGMYLKAVDTANCGDGRCTRTILLNDLLPLMRRRRAVMKVDVEGQQPQVFTEATAAKFFEMIDVPLIFMEWILCRGQNISTEVHDLMRFFTARQYQVFSSLNLPLRSNCRTWPRNVIFSKQSLQF